MWLFANDYAVCALPDAEPACLNVHRANTAKSKRRTRNVCRTRTKPDSEIVGSCTQLDGGFRFSAPRRCFCLWRTAQEHLQSDASYPSTDISHHRSVRSLAGTEEVAIHRLPRVSSSQGGPGTGEEEAARGREGRYQQ
eukprot:3623083-Rhodomonas_salina.1